MQPLLFALLPAKNQRIYETLFATIKNLVNNFNPRNIMLDFEQASINALKIEFP